VGASDVLISVVNRKGDYQLVKSPVGRVLEHSAIQPPREGTLGVEQAAIDRKTVKYGYAWLHSADWAVLVQYAPPAGSGGVLGMVANLLTFASAIVLAIVAVIYFRAKKLVQTEQEKDAVRFQLEHASKLASVGELAAGIAHEINNPLAIVASEVGLMKDMMDPQFGMNPTFEDLLPHLGNIRDAAYRCRDITGKLLSFVRQSPVDMGRHNIHGLLEEILSGFLEHELAVSNIKIVRNYCDNMPLVATDANQFKQVVLNIVNNARDAITPPGAITITTLCENGQVQIAISDTGKGITPDQMEKIFLPFYTTKDVGKGTGLGLSVSYGIIRHLGGDIQVESTPGEGSTFTIRLPDR
jgi:two-component system NtrC family sensor kinase